MHIHIAFGANLGDREENIHQAVQLMSQQVGPLVRCSSLIETAPVDMLSDNAFLTLLPSSTQNSLLDASSKLPNVSNDNSDVSARVKEGSTLIVPSTSICCNMVITTFTTAI